MISAKTQYETHDGKLLSIVEVLKIWRQDPEDCKYEVLVLINYNNLRFFIDIKYLSSKEVQGAQKLSKNYF